MNTWKFLKFYHTYDLFVFSTSFKKRRFVTSEFRAFDYSNFDLDDSFFI